MDPNWPATPRQAPPPASVPAPQKETTERKASACFVMEYLSWDSEMLLYFF